MAKELKMVNPCFQSSLFDDGSVMHVLTFDGWDGIGNVDEDGDEFYYAVTADTGVWNNAGTYAYGYSWFFDKVYEDDHVRADLSDTEIEIIINTMMEAIKNGGLE